ncbi:proto-oncogene tyrosine-protein kinase receptor Ret-like [Penaeus chinensis]|uniref:proto-oncogene tyrosine-protein kinase receptor Ret-like n=1 Tax=Penaeus chinensis TaxID=139456 RepID=UPI001FB759EE|nr:proto-oncogene tyrosine-protein kinase receptor Ret-like [Penaeus chinensis]
MVARPLSLAVILTVAGLASSTDTSRLTPSWNASVITVRIPKNFPLNEPLLTVALLYKADPPQEHHTTLDAEKFIKVLPGSTIGELRLPGDYEDAGIGMGPSRIGGDRPMGGLPKLPAGEQMVLLSNPKNLFHPRLQDSSDTLSLRLQRPLNLYDNSTNTAYSCVEAIIGLNGTQLEQKPTLGCGRRKNGRSRLRESGSSVLIVKILVRDVLNCDRPTKIACMLPVEDIVLHQWENRKPSPLLALPRVSVLCPNLRPNYTLTMKDPDSGPPELVTKPNQLVITPSRPLDRERRDDVLTFTVTCTLPGGEAPPQTRDGSIIILDEDDAAPIRSRNPKVDWHLRNSTDDLDDQLMVLDPDLEGTNNYEVKLLGETYNLVTIESVNKFSTRKQLCEMEAQNRTGFTFGADCTVMTPVLTFNRSNMRGNMPSKIFFSVVFIDRTLRAPITAINYKQNKQVFYNVTLTLPMTSDMRVRHPLLPEAAPSNLWATRDFPTLRETPPFDLNITVALPVAKYARLAQLISPAWAPPDQPPPPSNAFFSIHSDSSGGGLGVTPIMGILYVENPEELRPGEVVVVRETDITVVTLVLEISGAPACRETTPEKEVVSCAVHVYNTSCEQSCGLGAHGTCSWRSYEPNGNFVSTHFATCSPNLDTCPDGTCDELEQIHHRICPQDCTDKQWSKGQNLVLGRAGQGIVAGFGVCSCDSVCKCFPWPDVAPSTTTEYGKFPTKMLAPVWACGHWCKVGVSVGAVAFFVFILACAFLCRRRAGCGRKQKHGGISLGTFPSDDRSSSLPYNPRDETHDSLVHGIGLRNSPRPEHNFVTPINLAIDSKWEFPRNRLVIEQTLGEGEFGKVMKARAQGINGTLGYTTVAVKMLKSNSTPAELADLLSEYTLLKEVSHPNVVKLLGACTSKGGPIYIIIEYCQYGSLRNYLKRSRHFEFENRVGSGPSEGTAGDYAVTPKDLLSFAWQICKGMSYLTDMKLVHRDLAARNVLLASGKQCKISDFGLTRDVYEGDLYFKRSKGRVPVKWMALESLVDHVYTSKSDVWGFGILLWELVTLGTPPYPGITPERLFSLLKAGYRMEKPENCSQELYDVMLQCWAEDPNRRPTFQELTDIFDTMIQVDVEYLELRSLIVTNRGYFDGLPPPPPNPEQSQQQPPQPQVLDAPPQFRDSPPQFQDVSPASSSQHDVTPPPQPPPPPQLRLDESRLQRPESGWIPPRQPLDPDAYLVARTDLGRPCRAESTEPLLAAITPSTAAQTPTITTTHAHNPAYSPTSENLPPAPLHYSTLASRPDEEDAHTLECCRSEEDSDSGRATGDSGYATTEEGGRSRWRGGEHQLTPGANGGSAGRPLSHHHGGSSYGGSSPRGSSYSPLPRHDPEYQEEEEEEQDTSEDLEERQELLAEDLIGGGGHLSPIPSPEPTAAHTAQSAARTAAHASKGSQHHTTPIIV